MSHPTAASRDARGFSLIELLVGLAIMGIVLLGLFSTLTRTQRAVTRSTLNAKQRDGGRLAIQVLERDLRVAGSGWGTIPVQGSNGGAISWYAVTPGTNGNNPDSLTMIGAYGAHARLRANMASAASSIPVDSTAGFATDDLVVVTNGTTAHLFQVTGVDAGGKLLNKSTSSTWNASGGHAGFPATGYDIGSDVYRVRFVSYRVDSTNFRTRSLVRQELGQAIELVAYDIKDFKVWYNMNDGTKLRDTVDVADIKDVIPIIYTRTETATRQDSAWTAVHPRAY